MKFNHWNIVFNGEIYNYQEIRNELEAQDRTFLADGDTEVILQSFDAWGIAALEKYIDTVQKGSRLWRGSDVGGRV